MSAGIGRGSIGKWRVKLARHMPLNDNVRFAHEADDKALQDAPCLKGMRRRFIREEGEAGHATAGRREGCRSLM